MTHEEQLYFNRLTIAAITRLSSSLPLDVALRYAEDFYTGDFMMKWVKKFPVLSEELVIEFEDSRELWSWVKRFLNLNVRDNTVTINKGHIFSSEKGEKVKQLFKQNGIELVSYLPDTNEINSWLNLKLHD